MGILYDHRTPASLLRKYYLEMRIRTVGDYDTWELIS
jgi:hypothetical protein